MKTWLNGKVLATPDEPAVAVTDHGMIVGDGVFETIQISDNQPFALTRHLNRLTRSAEGLGIGTPDVGAIREGVAATMEGQDIPFGVIRVMVTSGRGPLGSPRGDEGLTSVVISMPKAQPSDIASIITVDWPRNERGAIAGLKTTSYAENALMIEAAMAKGASEAVMPNTQGLLCEGTGSNIMWVKDGRVRTPTLASGCLAGITRALTIEWCSGEVDLVEEDAPIEVLRDADEVMLVGTTRDVQAIGAVDGRKLPAPGPITAQMQAIWAREAAREIDP